MEQSLQYQLPSGGLILKHSAWKDAGQLSQQIRDPPIIYVKVYDVRIWIHSLNVIEWKFYFLKAWHIKY